jgi:hypothetical protein
MPPVTNSIYRIAENTNSDVSYKVEASFLEIYNENVGSCILTNFVIM